MLDERIHLLETDLNNAPSELKITTVEGEELVETKDMNSYLSKLIDNVNDKTKATSDASFKVANFNVTYTPPQYEEDVPKLKVTGALQYTIEISKNRSAGEIDSTLSNKLRTLFSKGLEKRLEEAKADYENKKLNLEQSKERITLPFESLDLLEQTQKEVEELTERVYEIQGKENSDNKEDIADENVDDDDMSVGCM